jgi:hypothetical protein
MVTGSVVGTGTVIITVALLVSARPRYVSFAFNLDYVTHFVRSDGGYVKLQTGESLIVSKSKKEAVMERLGLKKD